MPRKVLGQRAKTIGPSICSAPKSAFVGQRLAPPFLGQGLALNEHPTRCPACVIRTDSLSQDAGLILFQNFAIGPVELDAVAIIGNVAAGDHERGHTLAKGPQGKRRRRDETTIDRLPAQIPHRLRTGGENAGRTGPQITRERHATSGRPSATVCHELQKASGVGMAHPVGHGADKPARAAGAKGNAALFNNVGNA